MKSARVDNSRFPSDRQVGVWWFHATVFVPVSTHSIDEAPCRVKPLSQEKVTRVPRNLKSFRLNDSEGGLKTM